jgi:predicted ATPase/DNA-binding SARP family transcriptional activator
VEYRILGPLQLVHGGQPVRTPTGRPRDLLALLALEAGRVVATDRLIDGLWGETLPANPDNALQQQVHQLRKALQTADGVGSVETVRGGYRLDAPADAVDAHRFERLVAAGRRELAAGDAEAAVTAFTAALALWRGEALAGTATPWARAAARRYEELRLAAWEDRVEAELALGRHASVVAELEDLVRAEPLRERLRGQLVLALAGTGRQADALRVYTEGRELLAEELGIDPSPQLQRIHADVLAQRVPMAQEAPAVGPVPPPPSALPSPASSFVGREEELQRLGELVASERLVTVVGPGGAGKTRVAIEVARAAAGDVPDRPVHYVELAPLTEPTAVAATLADGIGVAGSKDVRVDDALRAALATGPALLVLDNCEHLLTGLSPLVHDLVARCPRLQVLATSREPLGIDGEVVWPLPTLGVPSAGAGTRADAERAPAVRLFLDRAREVAPDLDLGDQEVADVARIVRHLDGLPLAIELAAARMRVLSVEEIAARLHDRFRLLSGGRRSGPDRHRGLWDTLAWSWGLLDEAEQRAWMTAAVPVGPFPASLLGALLTAVDADLDALDAVTALCDRSLLTVHDRSGSPSRYRMLETLREFGAQRLAEAGLDAAARAAHAQAVEDAIAATDHTTTATWDVDLAAQRRWLPEARAALRWRAASGDRVGVQRLAAGLGWLWYLTALAPEGLRWLDAALGPIGAIDPDDVVPEAVFWVASLRVNEAPEDQGLRWAQLATDLAPDPHRASLARAVAATHRAVAGDLAGAYAEIDAEPTQVGWVEGYWRLLEGQLLALEGRATEAQPALATAERVLLDNGAWFGIWTSATLAQLELLQADPHGVRRTADRALEVCAHNGAPELEVELRCLIAMVAAVEGEHPAADDQLSRATAIVERTGVAMSQALVAITRGYVLGRRGRTADARRSLEDGLARHDRAGQAIGRPFALWCLGNLAVDDGDPDAAVGFHGEAFREALHRGDADGVASALEGLAAVCVADGRAALAARLLGAAEGRRASMGAPAPLLSRDAAAAADAAVRQVLPAERLAAERAAGAAAEDDSLDALLTFVAVST